MWAATLFVLPALPFFPSPASPTPGVWAAVLALGVLCSGIAYLIYFRLIEEVGPTSALTVTFLNPVFGILWGALFLGEVVGWHTLAGSSIVLVGTALVTGFVPRFGRAVPRQLGQMTTQLVTLALPAPYRKADVLAFHSARCRGRGGTGGTTHPQGGTAAMACRCCSTSRSRQGGTVPHRGRWRTRRGALASRRATPCSASSRLRIDPAPFAAFVRADPAVRPAGRASPACASCSPPPCSKR
jgi:hypothetical protein